MRHELEEQIVREDKGYPLEMVKCKIIVLCCFKLRLLLPYKSKDDDPMKSYLSRSRKLNFVIMLGKIKNCNGS